MEELRKLRCQADNFITLVEKKTDPSLIIYNILQNCRWKIAIIDKNLFYNFLHFISI